MFVYLYVYFNFFLKKIDKIGKKIKFYYIIDIVNEGNNNKFYIKIFKIEIWKFECY